MIVSHSRKFIFTCDIRCAGGTVKSVLSTLCKDGDYVSDTGPMDVLAISRIDGRRNKGGAHDLRKDTRAFRVDAIQSGFPGTDAYDVIGVCRNPYDLAYSITKWSLTRDLYPSVSMKPVTPEMVRDGLERTLNRKQFRRFLLDPDIYQACRDTGKLTMLRYENLSGDLARIFSRYGVAMPELPHLGSTQDVCPLSWQEVWTRKEINLINRRMKSYFTVFGYEMQ